MSHALISLQLFAQVGQDAVFFSFPPSLPLLLLSSAKLFFSSFSPSHCLSHSLPLSLCLCSTGTCGPTEALSYTKKPNWLSSEACYQLCALCNCAPSQHYQKLQILPVTLLLLLALSHCSARRNTFFSDCSGVCF